MKEALKLFGAMLAIIASVSVVHAKPAVSESPVICRFQLCSSDFDCPCGICFQGNHTCTTDGKPVLTGAGAF